MLIKLEYLLSIDIYRMIAVRIILVLFSIVRWYFLNFNSIEWTNWIPIRNANSWNFAFISFNFIHSFIRFIGTIQPIVKFWANSVMSGGMVNFFFLINSKTGGHRILKLSQRSSDYVLKTKSLQCQQKRDVPIENSACDCIIQWKYARCSGRCH